MPSVSPIANPILNPSGGPGAVQFVTKADFASKVLGAPGPVAVEFMSFACIHCRKANPIVHDVAASLAGQVKVYQVNVPAETQLTAEWGIVSTPTFIMFKNGQELGRSNPMINAYGIRHAILGPFGL